VAAAKGPGAMAALILRVMRHVQDRKEQPVSVDTYENIVFSVLVRSELDHQSMPLIIIIIIIFC
jgi:hypothetical protein